MKSTLHRIPALWVLTILLLMMSATTVTTRAASPVPPDTIYLAVVDCALPPVSFTAMAAAFGEDAILPSFSGLVKSDAGQSILKETFARIKQTFKPEVELKHRLASYFSKLFTVDEAKQITASCAPGVGFSDKALLDKFQAALDGISPEAQKQSVLVTCAFMGKLMSELSSTLSPLTPTELGFESK